MTVMVGCDRNKGFGTLTEAILMTKILTWNGWRIARWSAE